MPGCSMEGNAIASYVFHQRMTLEMTSVPAHHVWAPTTVLFNWPRLRANQSRPAPACQQPNRRPVVPQTRDDRYSYRQDLSNQKENRNPQGGSTGGCENTLYSQASSATF
ncbi:hypothetical protein NHX12_022164 [Muraenolepis orangiensis]|uniref:Uncharacterized protein n=1 Tax=Muraenolepis orangiensis TaxID=630683 RepID=A0A9Q0ER32_9TELE|nr:hypothetical protein NHX12_022164 [Muraenolepis orangiensis]